MKKLVSLVLCCILAVASCTVAFAANATTEAPYLKELLVMADQIRGNGIAVEVSELKSPAQLDDYDRAIIEANKQSSAKFVRSIGVENNVSIESFKDELNSITESAKSTDRILKESKSKNPVDANENNQQIAPRATKTLTKTCSNNNKFKITATCTGTPTTTIGISNMKIAPTALGVITANNVFSDGQVWEVIYMDTGRTKRAQCTANFVSGTLANSLQYRATVYADFYRSEL